jgi:hypothetical protein
MATAIIKLVGVAMCPQKCDLELINVLFGKALLNNIIKKGCMHHFDQKASVSTSFSKKI